MKYNYSIPCDTKSLKKHRVKLSDILNNYSISEVDKNAMILAVDEVCANIIIHSHNCSPSDDLHISITIDEGDKVVFEIIDPHGSHFDINQYKEPSLNEIIKKKRKGGVGLILVKRIMDNIEVIKVDGKVTFRLIKSI